MRTLSPAAGDAELLKNRKVHVETIPQNTAAGTLYVGPFYFTDNNVQRQDVLVSIVSKGALNCAVVGEQAAISKLDDYTNDELYHPFGESTDISDNGSIALFGLIGAAFRVKVTLNAAAAEDIDVIVSMGS